MKVFVIAGESSGDRLGAALIEGLKSLVPDVQITGVGGPMMAAQGVRSLVPLADLAVMGIAEVLPKLPKLLRHIRETADEICDQRPDVLITIDSPDFCLRVARRVRAARPAQRVVHYVAPSVWAWRPERAAKMSCVVDQVLCLLPFEPPYMQAEGMRADFVGHPVTTEPVPKQDELSKFRETYDLTGTYPVILALPGSRKGEVDRLMPIFGAALDQLAKHHPNARIVLPTVPHLTARVTELALSWPHRPTILGAEGPDAAATKRAAFAAADIALAASGTVSLELAAAATPMVIAYDMNWISRWIIASKLRIDTVTLVNLVSDTRDIPEFLGAKCQPSSIAAALGQVLAHPDHQRAAMTLTMERLGRGQTPPGLRAAQAVLDGLTDKINSDQGRATI